MTGRVLTIDVDVPRGEVLAISPVTDLHVEGASCAIKEFTTEMRDRGSRFEFHRGLLVGDAMDCVYPKDFKRSQPHVLDPSLLGRDDWINASLEVAEERLKATGVKWDMVSPGNHEDELKKRTGYDVTSALARALNASRGGYFGVVRYRIKDPKDDRSKNELLNVAFHHGAWGGRVQKGYGGARDFFRMIDGWHFAVFGHNHHAKVEPELHFRPTPSGLVEFPAYYVLCGTWTRSHDRDPRITTYSERAGYAATPSMSPILLIKHLPHGGLKYTAEL